jgi:hypothetical protein
MKPLKGMNLDVSPDSQPQGTYRMAKNWVYDSEFDGLIQAPGRTAKEEIIGDHVLGQHAFENGDIVFLVYSAQTAVNDSIKLWTASTNTYSTILTDAALDFRPTRQYQIVSFINTDNERVIIITDSVTKPLVINIDLQTQPAYALQNLFPTREYPTISLESHSTGSLTPGTYFYTVQYEMADGTRTDFGPVTGPFRVVKDPVGMVLDLDRIDTNYPKLRIAVLGITNSSVVSKVVAETAITGVSMDVFVQGATLEEALIEELAILPVSYSSAKTVEWHDNRLYLGNVTSSVESVSTYQAYANQIQAIWELKKGSTSGAQSRTTADTSNHKFMPDEVYAFYVAWVRDDGTYTKAYHIPGRPSRNYDQKIPSGASGLPQTATRTVSETATLTSIINSTSTDEANEDGHLNYLKNDRNIFESSESGYDDVKFFHTRCTASAFTDTSTHHHGEMGYWQNDNEVYPADHPVAISYAWDSSGTSVGSISSAATAGEKVRHHRMPSLSWLMFNVGTFDFDSYQNHGLDVRFDFVKVPVGCKGAVFYHAQRDNSNNIVMSHTPIHFGARNTYSQYGEGGLEYKHYSTQAAINARNSQAPLKRDYSGPSLGLNISSSSSFHNDTVAAAGNPKRPNGTSFPAADYYTDSDNDISTFATEINDRLGVHYNKAVCHAQDIVGTRPALPSHMYTRLEYMLIQEEHFPDAVEGKTGGSSNTRNHIMSLADSSSDNFYSTTDDADGTNQARRALFDFTTFSSGVNQSFPQSEVLPCRNQRYLPAGVIDEEVKFDNRFAPECLYWDYENIGNTQTPYSHASAYHNAGDRLWYSVLNNPDTYGDTGSGDTDDARWTTTYSGTTDSQRNFHGWHPQAMHTRARILAVQRLPFVNINAMRFNCYPGRERQELVACSSYVSGTTGGMVNSPLINGGQGSTKSVPISFIHGDVTFSATQYRVTAALGYDIGFNDADENTLAASGNPGTDSTLTSRTYTELSDGGTTSSGRGVVIALMKVNTLSPVESFLHNYDKAQHKETETESLLRRADPSETNDLSIDADLMRLNNWVQPVISDGATQDASIYSNRIARSRQQSASSDTLNFRSFAALDFFEQDRNRGSIQNIQSYGDKLLIHHEDSLYITVGKESVQTSTGAVVLGSGDIFRVKPQELTPTDFGFGGTQHWQSAVLTPQGYFWVDAKRKKVFLYNGKINEISNRGMRGWFEKTLEFDAFYNDTSGGAINTFNPGLQSTYDPQYNRVLLLIRKQQVINLGNDEGIPKTLTDYYSTTARYLPKDQVISYSFNNNAWVSLHDMVYNGFVASASKLYGWQTSGTKHLLFELNALTDATVTYISDFKTGATSPAFIDVAFPANEPVQWQSFSWHTKAKNHVLGSTNEGHIDLNKTFEKAAVYNDYQCSGDVSFVRASAVDVTSVQQVTLRHNGTRYQFNGFRDLVNDRTARFLDPDYNIVTENINASKNWFDQKRFKSTHAVIRLTAPHTTTNLLYLYDVDTKVRKAHR